MRNIYEEKNTSNEKVVLQLRSIIGKSKRVFFVINDNNWNINVLLRAKAYQK